MYEYVHEHDEHTFQLVDSTRLPKPAYQKRTRFQQNVNKTIRNIIKIMFTFLSLAFSSTTNAKWTFSYNAKNICWYTEKI